MKSSRFRTLARWLAGAVLFSGCGMFGYEGLQLTAPPLASDACGNQLLDGDELGIDCGGPSCPACALGVACTPGPGCGEPVCLDSSCATASCSDGIQNQDEAAIDCGGSLCAPCAPSCTDGMQNGDEPEVDCGGSLCAACAGTGCTSGGECASAVCAAAVCQAATCTDGVQNQDETAIDCGGSSCAPCPSCSDTIQNQDETAIDCGGSSCAPCPSCSDGVQNRDEAGTDCGGSFCVACGTNTPPLARLTVTPGIGSFDAGPATVFSGDASGSSDLQDAPAALSYAWDWENDGVVDATGPSSTHSYGSAGTFEVRLTVQDTGGLRATATFLAIVTSTSDLIQVTTAADESDPSATPAAPQGTGLSLREAIAYANATAGKQSILVPAGFVIALASQLPSPTDAAGLDIVGDGAIWDGSGTGPADDCIQSAAPETRIFGFEIRNCRRSPLRLAFGAAGSHFSRLHIHDFSQPIILYDSDVTLGPHNEVSGSAGHCVSVLGPSQIIQWNFVHDCATRAVDLTGASSGALLLGNIVSRSETGVFLGNGADNCVLVHNVLHDNLGDGLWVGGANNAGNQLRNNIFSNNAGYGARAADAAFTANEHNDYFANALGTCSECSSLGTGSLTSDPAYIDAASGDFRLSPASPNIDAGAATGHDLNGPEPGNGLFNGSNPDIGAREMD